MGLAACCLAHGNHRDFSIDYYVGVYCRLHGWFLSAIPRCLLGGHVCEARRFAWVIIGAFVRGWFVLNTVMIKGNSICELSARVDEVQDVSWDTYLCCVLLSSLVSS